MPKMRKLKCVRQQQCLVAERGAPAWLHSIASMHGRYVRFVRHRGTPAHLQERWCLCNRWLEQAVRSVAIHESVEEGSTLFRELGRDHGLLLLGLEIQATLKFLPDQGLDWRLRRRRYCLLTTRSFLQKRRSADFGAGARGAHLSRLLEVYIPFWLNSFREFSSR